VIDIDKDEAISIVLHGASNVFAWSWKRENKKKMRKLCDFEYESNFFYEL